MYKRQGGSSCGADTCLSVYICVVFLSCYAGAALRAGCIRRYGTHAVCLLSLIHICAILQRMRELSVQAANGTNSLEDKQAIQDEIEALKDEVNRISKDTEYNSKSLLDGSLDTRVYTDNANVCLLYTSRCV